jgi:hypothetical protein
MITMFHTGVNTSPKKHDTTSSSQINKTDSTTIYNSSKGKAIPLQVWTGPEGSRRLRIPDCKTITT